MNVEWLILADAAEVVNNRVYLIGGGWETLTINSRLPYSHPIAVAIAFTVPWSETGRKHHVTVAVVDPLGDEMVNVAGQIEVGKPAGVPRGESQRVQMAISVALPLQRLGDHAVVVRIEGQDLRRALIHVVPGPEFAGRHE